VQELLVDDWALRHEYYSLYFFRTVKQPRMSLEKPQVAAAVIA
jgi:hypothetical protein